MRRLEVPFEKTEELGSSRKEHKRFFKKGIDALGGIVKESSRSTKVSGNSSLFSVLHENDLAKATFPTPDKTRNNKRKKLRRKARKKGKNHEHE